MLIFEFFSGIGGLHQGVLNNKQIIGEFQILPYDVNLEANKVYEYNFGISPSTLSLEYLKLDLYENLCRKIKHQNIAWLMSPPCQPYTCQGNKMDLNDTRSKSLKNLINLLNSESRNLPNYFFLENVENFAV